MSKINKLLLASKSKRRLDLLEQVGIKPDIILPSNIDESIFSREGLPSKISSVIILTNTNPANIVKGIYHNPNKKQP